MEENNNKELQQEEKNMSYEQLQTVAMQLQQKLMMVENRLRSIDYAAMRLNYLFKVLEFKNIMPEDFVKKSVAEVVELLTIDDTPEKKVEE